MVAPMAPLCCYALSGLFLWANHLKVAQLTFFLASLLEKKEKMSKVLVKSDCATFNGFL
jgi:hypothetical protein